jgi:hypothetical protein
MGWAPGGRELLEWFAKYDSARRSRAREEVSKALQKVPASREALDALGELSPEDAGRALRTHPGYQRHRRIESARTMLELFHLALADLAAAIREFPELGSPHGRAAREELEKNVSVRVNKELFAALGAASTLVDYGRRLKELVDADLFDSKLKQAFHPGESALVKGLRNSVLHQAHFKANWQQRWSAGGKSTHFVIQREALIMEGELNSTAREYLDRLGKTCDVTELSRSYSERVDQFNTWILSEVESNLPLEVSDYRRCRKSVKRQHGRLSYEFMIGMWTQAGADPYKHLAKRLTSTQLKEMEALPHRSPQQVDYIIACLDEDGICDDKLRTLVYKFFKVRGSDKDVHERGEPIGTE